MPLLRLPTLLLAGPCSLAISILFHAMADHSGATMCEDSAIWPHATGAFLSLPSRIDLGTASTTMSSLLRFLKPGVQIAVPACLLLVAIAQQGFANTTNTIKGVPKNGYYWEVIEGQEEASAICRMLRSGRRVSPSECNKAGALLPPSVRASW